jgi:type II secretion system protein G
MLNTRSKYIYHGFTLIELLIVIVVIAILALIVIPRTIMASDRARSATYNFNLHQLEDALEHFHADCGVYPATLADLSAFPGHLSTTTTSYTSFTAAFYGGPYLVAANSISSSIPLPPNPYVDDTQLSNQTVAAHWLYTPGGAPLGSNYTLVGAVEAPSGN